MIGTCELGGVCIYLPHLLDRHIFGFQLVIGGIDTATHGAAGFRTKPKGTNRRLAGKRFVNPDLSEKLQYTTITTARTNLGLHVVSAVHWASDPKERPLQSSF